jgi:hypothetical protein
VYTVREEIDLQKEGEGGFIKMGNAHALNPLATAVCSSTALGLVSNTVVLVRPTPS